MSHMMKASALRNLGKTNRLEAYPTPVSLVRMMVKQAFATRSIPVLRSKKSTVVRVLDLCAGSAVWGIVAKEELEKLGLTVHLTAIELDDVIQPAPEVDEWIQADFREIETLGLFDFILSNPPFSLVYEITAWVQRHLTPWGIFTLLIGSNFMFAETLLNKWLKDIRPILELKLTRRPSFIQPFAVKRKGNKKNKKGTNAKDYCGYFFAGDELNKWLVGRMEYPVYLFVQSDTQPWVTVDVYWEYEEDPLEAVLLERPVTVQQALMREAAEAKGNALAFDFYWALMAANEYGWALYEADYKDRFDMIDAYVKKHTEGQLWEGALSTTDYEKANAYVQSLTATILGVGVKKNDEL